MVKIKDQQQVVAVAARVFAQKGYEATRLQDIATELGVLPGSLYYYVDSKSALFQLVLRRRFDAIIDDLDALMATSSTAQEKLREALRVQLRYIARYQSQSPQWFDADISVPRTATDIAEDQELLARLRARWKQILEQGVAEGVVAEGVDLSVVAVSILGMANYVARWFKADGPLTIDEVADLQFQMVWSGLSTPT